MCPRISLSLVEQPKLARTDQRSLLHRLLGLLERCRFARVVAGPPAVDSVPFSLGTELDKAQTLFAQPVPVGRVAAFPECPLGFFLEGFGIRCPQTICMSTSTRSAVFCGCRAPAY